MAYYLLVYLSIALEIEIDNEQYINFGMNEIDVKGNFNVSNDLNQIEDWSTCIACFTPDCLLLFLQLLSIVVELLIST